jgi:hypothetical protein
MAAEGWLSSEVKKLMSSSFDAAKAIRSAWQISPHQLAQLALLLFAHFHHLIEH